MEFVQPIRDQKQIESIKKILKATNLRDYCLFTLGINSGLRVSDLLKLNLLDVLNEKRKVKDRIELREKKTEKYKNFPISDTAKKAITEYLSTRDLSDLDQPLFISRKPDKDGEYRLQRQQAYKIINDAAKEVGIKDRIGTHTMRKTFGYMAYQSGVDITRIQKLLNHSSPSVTLEYIGITREQLDEVYLNLNL